jgi:hypothetical protein
MINFQDELAFLNHRLEEMLEMWRKKHRLHGRLFFSSLNSLVVLVILFLQSFCNGSNTTKAALLCFGATTLLVLIFSSYSRGTHAKMLMRGYALKNLIYNATASLENAERVSSFKKLRFFQKSLVRLLMIELGSPVCPPRTNRIPASKETKS